QKDGLKKEAGNLAGKQKDELKKEAGNLAGKQKDGLKKEAGNLAGKQKDELKKEAGNLAGKQKDGLKKEAGNLGGKTQSPADKKDGMSGKGSKSDELEGFYGKKKKKEDVNSEADEENSSGALSLDKDKKKKETEVWEDSAKSGMKGKGEKSDELESYYGKKKNKAPKEDIQDDVQTDGTLSLEADKKKKETEGWSEDNKNGMKGKGSKSDEIESYYGKKKKPNEESLEEKNKKAEADSLDDDKNRKKENGYSFESGPGKKKDAPTMEAEDPKKNQAEESEFESLFSKSGSEIKYAKKKDWGEQTIDYKKLNDEFGGISTDREGSDGSDLSIGDTPTPDKIKQENTKDGIETVEIPIIEAKPNGLDDLVSILEMYMSKKSPSIILDEIGEKLISKGASWCVFCKSNGKKLEMSSYAGVDPVSASKLVKENNEHWVSQGLPIWSDPTWQEEQNQFIFPYFEGITPLGVLVAKFESNVDEELSIAIEIITEGARGIFLDQHIKVSKEKKESKSVLGKLFGKKAG
ncbi:MAG: hypothetical protein KC493_01120, partial [Bacteriovoracaceae bacterium]|nr:hypothetical protein [Bacteriovoracaceae bacterium]